VTQQTFRAGEKIPTAHLEKRRMQYLYSDGDQYYFMDVNSFEQMPILEEQLGDSVKFLRENTEVEVLTFKNRMVGVDLPTAVSLEVTDTVPGVRGDTVSGATKPAVVETGAEVQVPLFINEGDVIRVDTRSGEYLERVRSR
jgi:elongation factor P